MSARRTRSKKCAHEEFIESVAGALRRAGYNPQVNINASFAAVRAADGSAFYPFAAEVACDDVRIHFTGALDGALNLVRLSAQLPDGEEINIIGEDFATTLLNLAKIIKHLTALFAKSSA